MPRRQVEIQLPEIDYKEQHIILIDDVISTGNTVAQTANKLYKKGSKQVDIIATHALFSHNAIELLNNANIKNIWTSNSITHSSNYISLDNLLATQMKTLL